MGTKSSKSSSNLNDRFQIHDHAGSDAVTLASFATREAADEALLTMRKEDSVAASSYVLADIGPSDPEAREENVAAGKTAEQKETERLALEAKVPVQA